MSRLAGARRPARGRGGPGVQPLRWARCLIASATDRHNRKPIQPIGSSICTPTSSSSSSRRGSAAERPNDDGPTKRRRAVGWRRRPQRQRPPWRRLSVLLYRRDKAGQNSTAGVFRDQSATPPEVTCELGHMRAGTRHTATPFSGRYFQGATGALLSGFRFFASDSGCQTPTFWGDFRQARQPAPA